MAAVGGGLTCVVRALHVARKGAEVDLFAQHTRGFGAFGRPDPRPDGQAGQHDGVYCAMEPAGHGVQTSTHLGQMAEVQVRRPQARGFGRVRRRCSRRRRGGPLQ